MKNLNRKLEEMSKLHLTGFIKPEFSEKDFVLGASKLPQNILQPNGQWTDYLPPAENQRAGGLTQDPCNCTAINTHTAIEILNRRIYKDEFDASERFTTTLAGIRPPGAVPTLSPQSIRHNGLIEEKLLPVDENIRTLEQYYAGITDELKAKGQEWNAYNEFGWEWVFTDEHDKEERIKRIKQALQYSPLGIAVDAWNEQNGMYVSLREPGHWTCLVGYVENYYWLVYDSYSPNLKKLQWDFDIQYAMRYHISRRSPEEAAKRLAEGINENHSIIKYVSNLFENFLLILRRIYNQEPLEIPAVQEVERVEPSEDDTKVVDPLANWDTPEEARHCIRVICDEMGVSYYWKNVITAVIQAESGFNIKAKHVNTNKTTDWGIVQINDYWWIGPGKYFASVDEVLNNPEKCVRFMVRKCKEGKLTLWSAFNNGLYLKYMPK